MSIVESGLYPIFLDIDKNSAQLTPQIVENYLNKNLNFKKNVIAVMPVSPFGSRLKKKVIGKCFILKIILK